jgi:hypothetical protein
MDKLIGVPFSIVLPFTTTHERELQSTYTWKFTKGKHDRTCFYFGDRSTFRLLCWGVPHVPKNIGDGPIKLAPLRGKKTVGTPPSLLNKKTHQHPQAITSPIKKKKKLALRFILPHLISCREFIFLL